MRRALGFGLAALAYASGLAGLLRYGRMCLQNRWSEHGDGVLFWLLWANDPGSRRIFMAGVLAIAVLALAWAAQRTGWKLLQPAASVVRFGGHPLVVAGGLLLALAPHVVAPLVRPDAGGVGKPSVVIILLDSVRLDATGWGGSTLPGVTPRLDALAQRGARFTQAISQSSWTKPSVATLLTGLTPSRHLAVGRPTLGYYPNLPLDRRTLGEAFAAAGYDTAAISTNPNISYLFGFTQGFQSWQEDTLMPATGVIAAAERWIEARDDPFFLYLHFNDAHYPYSPVEGFRGLYDRTGLDAVLDGTTEKEFREGKRVWSEQEMEHFRRSYAEEVRYLDEHVGALVERLLQAHDDLFVAILADHGEEFLEHGDVGHGHSLYDELLRVPMQFSWGEKLPYRPLAHAGQVRSMDLTPTVLEVAGLAWPAGAHALDGTSLVPLLQGQALPDLPAFAETDSLGSLRSGPTGPLRAWREPGEKLILTDPWSKQAGRHWWFDLAQDPGEQHNRAQAEAGRAGTLFQRLEATDWLLRKDPLPEVPVDPSHLPQEVRDSLNELGYAGDVESIPADAVVNFMPGAVRWQEVEALRRSP